MNEEAIKIWRDTFKLNLNQSRRRDIQVTVKDLELWKDVLTNWGYWKDGKWIKFNPLSVGKMLSEYERRARNNHSVSKPRTGSEDRQAGVSERGQGGLLQVREGTSVHVRGVRKTLAEIVTSALSETDRP